MSRLCWVITSRPTGGTEFFAYQVQERFQEYGIKFRPNKPRSPQLNDKVERSQKTDKIEFYALCDLDDPALDVRLTEWQYYYNWHRPNGSLNGKTPMERAIELADNVPLWEEVSRNYIPSKERIKDQSYQADLAVLKLKGSP